MNYHLIFLELEQMFIIIITNINNNSLAQITHSPCNNRTLLSVSSMSMIDVNTLQKLLTPGQDSDSDSDTDCVKYTPGDIGKSKPKSKIPDVRKSNLYLYICMANLLVFVMLPAHILLMFIPKFTLI